MLSFLKAVGGGYLGGGKVAKKSAGGKTTVKKEESKVEAEEITEKSLRGVYGEATSQRRRNQAH